MDVSEIMDYGVIVFTVLAVENGSCIWYFDVCA